MTINKIKNPKLSKKVCKKCKGYWDGNDDMLWGLGICNCGIKGLHANIDNPPPEHCKNKLEHTVGTQTKKGMK
jgi:hypothetical protein